ncbi:MAG: hypothetical protein ACRDSL_23190 [Pseudonocardiaceae bacterium]
MLQRLQRGAGNRAVAGLLAKRRGTPPQANRAPKTTAPQPPSASDRTHTATPPSADTPAPATETELPEKYLQRLVPGTEAPARRSGPNTDPKFTALKRDVKGKQTQVGKHPPAKSEATASQAAAKPPQDDKEAQGKTANAEKMNAAKPGEFDKAAFIKAVNDAIAAQAPKNLDEADKFGDSGKADAVKGQVQGKVGAGKKASAGEIESTTKAPPDTSKAKEKQVTPLKPDQPPPTPGAPDASKAVPDKAPPAATDFSAGPKQVDQQMADAQVTEEQLAKSNEPEFQGALKDKKAGEQHAATAPGQVRGKEAQTLSGAKAQAAQAGATAMTALSADRKQAGAQVAKGKEGAKGKDESKRAEVTAKLQKVFDATKKDVEDILSGLDKKVDEKFTKDEKAARDAFTAEHKRKMDEYKDKRYSGFTGKLRWVKDQFAGLPDEANQIFVQARKGYVDRMQQVISGIADVIGADLTKAKQRIATGRTQLQAEVKSLGPGLEAIGKEAAAEFSGKFDELTESVDAKGKELVDTLATKYNEALKSVDDEIAAEKEKNKGLIAKAVDAVKGVIDTILKLKDLLLGILAKAAQAVMAIIKDPIGFLGKLVSAVGAGLKAFIANIAGHLKKGLVGWLMGAMSGAGLELPAKFDLRGIIMMIGSLLGLTWAAIRGRIISRGVPAQAMETVEQSAPVAQKLRSEGIGGIWEQIKEKVGDLKENLFSKISEYLIPTVLIAGITWIISLLNPASAFIKACKMIVDIVTFIVERGAQIVQFVNAVLDAVIAIAGGGAGGVPALIENALALSIPVLIGALAAILGISGIADKVKKFFQSLSKPVMKAVDWVVGKIVAFGKKIWAKLRGAGKKAKDKIKSLLKPVTKTFSMKGSSHNVKATPGPPFRLTMASSSPGRLVGRIQFATQLLRRKSPQATEQLAALADLNQFAIVIENTGRQAERGDSSSAKRLETQLTELSSKIVTYANKFNTKDLDDLDPLNDIQLTIRQAEAAGDKRRLAAIDMATIRLQLERVMGGAWNNFATSFASNVWTLSRESLVRVYGKATADEMINSRNNPLDGNGLYDPRKNQMFVKMGRSITEVASSITHEGTHSLQNEFGGKMERFEKEFQAFSVQRNFFLRLKPEARAQLPENYQKLLRCETDADLRDFVAGRYPRFSVTEGLKQRADAQFIKQLVKREFGQ